MQHFVETSDAELRSVTAPTLILLGDHDVVTPEHALELSRLLPGARLTRERGRRRRQEPTQPGLLASVTFA